MLTLVEQVAANCSLLCSLKEPEIALQKHDILLKMPSLDQIRIVLVEPSHPGNIGATARAMKTMRLKNLSLVNPLHYPHEDAKARAAGAVDLLQQSKVHNNLSEAVADCDLVMGASVRSRQIEWPTLDLVDASKMIFDHLQAGSKDSRVALLFGRERSGLSNAELDRCDFRLSIAANEAYSSLNLASAVQIVCYQLQTDYLLRLATPENIAQPKVSHRNAQADSKMQNDQLQHLLSVLAELQFAKPHSSRNLERKLARIFKKARLSIEEVQLLRGIWKSMQNHLARKD